MFSIIIGSILGGIEGFTFMPALSLISMTIKRFPILEKNLFTIILFIIIFGIYFLIPVMVQLFITVPKVFGKWFGLAFFLGVCFYSIVLGITKK